MKNHYITSAQALDMLQTLAPRPWARRMLSWHTYEKLGVFHFLSGRITERHSAIYFRDVAKPGEWYVDDLPVELIEFAATQPPSTYIDIPREPPTEWPIEFPVQAVFQCEEFDWERGILRGDLVDEFPAWFENEEFAKSHPRSHFNIDLQGLCFSLSEIEMLAPLAPRPETTLFDAKDAHPEKRPAGPGRRRKHDWDSALFALIGEAERNGIVPDPDAHGAQADVANRLAEWFAQGGSEIPANSQLQAAAKRVLESIRAANPKP